MDSRRGPLTLELLPHEVLLRCLSHLSASELLSCQMVSQVWREVAQDRSLWRELLGGFVRSSPFVCVNHNIGLQPFDGQWQSTYFRLMRLVYMKGHAQPRPSGLPHQQPPHQKPRTRNNAGVILPSCPFCEAMMQEPENPPLPAESQPSRKLLICCTACNLFVWINGCEQCCQATAHLTKCVICSAEVCARCFGSAGKRCEQCNTNGCKECVRPKATFAETNQRPGAGPKKKKKTRKNSGKDNRQSAQSASSTSSSSTSHEHHQQHHLKSVAHLCTYCGVLCAECGRVFESEDTDFCVACQSSVCYSCDCPCGALDMFQQMRL